MNKNNSLGTVYAILSFDDTHYLNRIGKDLKSHLLGGAIRFVRWRMTKLMGGKASLQINLYLVLRYVARLTRYLHGRLIISVDHGELLGEHRLYGHSPSLKLPQLVKVPWLEVSKK